MDGATMEWLEAVGFSNHKQCLGSAGAALFLGRSTCAMRRGISINLFIIECFFSI
jgi:hypothetical protein